MNNEIAVEKANDMLAVGEIRILSVQTVCLIMWIMR